ncbi:anti-sigma factor [Metabacillus sp. KIGAM252]|uniref:Anti-sigma-W factor RsiW n=1 Tax=Metabacillus flavus TaxID=2823519 RepID=A0ABS5L9J9_9BACI|nr:anti-sigma factor [Metabacillus flavus]MBS2967378.1 anti-sigma factor [Metabacillus flavus]
MACAEHIVSLMHKYLDHETNHQEETELRGHLKECEACKVHFQELKKTIALVQSTSHVAVSDDFTARVMADLPKEKRRIGAGRWFKAHPLLMAASLFVIMMSGSLVSAWSSDHQFSVTKNPKLIVQNNTVTVPEGEVVEGDITVRNGTLQVDGKVNGNVTVINGEEYTAAAGEVTGDISEVNELFDWLWYKMKSFGSEVVDVFQ